jgi:hypothetical protein
MDVAIQFYNSAGFALQHNSREVGCYLAPNEDEISTVVIIGADTDDNDTTLSFSTAASSSSAFSAGLECLASMGGSRASL